MQLTGHMPFGVAAAQPGLQFTINTGDSQAELLSVMEQHASWVKSLSQPCFGLVMS